MVGIIYHCSMEEGSLGVFVIVASWLSLILVIDGRSDDQDLPHNKYRSNTIRSKALR